MEEDTNSQAAPEEEPAKAPVQDSTVYCLCDNVGGSGFMIECSDGSGGCNGWFHPACCGLELTKEVMEKITEYSFTCSLCIAKQVAEKNKKKAKSKSKSPALKPKEDKQAKAPKSGKPKGPKKNAKRANSDSMDVSSSSASSSTFSSSSSLSSASGQAKRAKVVGRSGLARNPLEKKKQEVSGFADEAAIRAALRPERSASSGGGGGLGDGDGTVMDESIMVVDKILGRKLAPPPEPVEDELSSSVAELDNPQPPPPPSSNKPVEWFLVKWRGLSYLHASWEVAEDIEAVDLQGRVKLRRFLSTEPKLFDETTKDGAEELKELEFIEPEFIEVQTVLNCETSNPKHAEEFVKKKKHSKSKGKGRSTSNSESAATDAEAAALARGVVGPIEDDEEDNKWWKDNESEDSIRYLIKWRGLPYSEATWEDFGVIKTEAHAYVKDFWYRERLPPNKTLEKKAMPPELKHYKRLTCSPLFGIYPDKEGNMPNLFPDASFVASSTNESDQMKIDETVIADEMAVDKKEDDNEGPPSTELAVASADAMDLEEVDAVEEVVEDTTPVVDVEVALEEAKALGLTLRDYQLEGVNWLFWNWFNQRPSILADEMGLGKTIQTIGLFHRLRHTPETKLRGPFLIVAPLSLVYQWQNEATIWAPDMNCIVYHGSGDSRSVMQEHEFWYREPYVSRDEAAHLKKDQVTKFDVMVTTFEVAIKDISVLSKIPWRVLVVDEAHRLKNPDARLFQQLQLLRREHCILLTGTPLQNRTEELWALLHFASPDKFPYLDQFVERFGDLKVSSQVAQLHSLLKPYLLRRVKEDVEKSLPPKEETIIEVSLTAVQKQFYRAIYERNTESLFKDVKPSSAPCLMNVMMELRKCCNHPYLNRGVEELIIEQIPMEKQTRTNLHLQMVNSSGKMVLLDKLLPRLAEQGHKVLIFSQMVRVLDLLEDYIRHKGYLYERLDGSSRSSDRSAGVGRFNRPSCKRFIMLLSTRAGGLGLNLTSADTVIIFDSDWNPHNDIQAQARAHRIGQTRAVMVYRLITTKTYEMHMFHKASLKLGLDKAVLAHAKNEAEKELHLTEGGAVKESSEELVVAKDDPTKSAMDMHAKEIDELLKRGAYDVFREDDADVKAFVEADIDSILERSVKKITYMGGDQSESNDGNKAPASSFSKASFVGTNNDEDIDLDDPDFWKKAVGLNQPAGFVEEVSELDSDGSLLGGPNAANRKKRRMKKGTKEETALLAAQKAKEEAAALTSSEEAAKLLVAAAAEEMQVPIVKPPTPPPEPEPEPEPEPAPVVETKSDSASSSSSKSNEPNQKPVKKKGKSRKKETSESKNDDDKDKESASTGSAAAAAKSRARDRRPPKPPKDWGPHNRDRLIRALMLFGFGRWDRLRRESGATNRLLGDVENVSRAYIYVCGLAAAHASVDGEHMHPGPTSNVGRKRIRGISPDRPLPLTTSSSVPLSRVVSNQDTSSLTVQKYYDERSNEGFVDSESGKQPDISIFDNLRKEVLSMDHSEVQNGSSSLTLDPTAFNVVDDSNISKMSDGQESMMELDLRPDPQALLEPASSDQMLNAVAPGDSVPPLSAASAMDMSGDLGMLYKAENGDLAAAKSGAPKETSSGRNEAQVEAELAEAEAAGLARSRFMLSTALSRETSPWVRECMETSVRIDELRCREAPKRIKVHVPNILLDHKFLAKLRAGGARKALLRLELLTKLHQLVAAARERAFKRLDTTSRVASGLKRDGTLEVNPADYISPLYSDEAHTLKRRKGGLLRHINRQRQRLGLSPLFPDVPKPTSSDSSATSTANARDDSVLVADGLSKDSSDGSTSPNENKTGLLSLGGNMPPPPIVDPKVIAEKAANEKAAAEKLLQEKLANEKLAEKRANRSSWYGQPGVMGVDLSLVCDELPLNRSLPHWTRLAPWWDDVADAHLVLGTYRHGYGKYDMMVADPELCFGKRLDEFSVYHADALKITGEDSTTVSNDNASSSPASTGSGVTTGSGRGATTNNSSTNNNSTTAAAISASARRMVINPPMIFALTDVFNTSDETLGVTTSSMQDDDMVDSLSNENKNESENESGDRLVRMITLPGWKSSCYRGVYGQPGSTRWLAQTGEDPQHSRFLGFTGTLLGSFDTEEDAARAYDDECRRNFGDAAICNFNEDGTRCVPHPPPELFIPCTYIPSANSDQGDGDDSNFNLSSGSSSLAATSSLSTHDRSGSYALERMSSEQNNIGSVMSSMSKKEREEEEAGGDKPAPPLFSASTTITSPAVYALAWRRESPYRGVVAAGCKWEASYDSHGFESVYTQGSAGTNSYGPNHDDEDTWQYLGTYATELEAALAHDEAEYQMYSAAANFAKSGGASAGGRRGKKGSKSSRAPAPLPPLPQPLPPRLNFPQNDPINSIDAVLKRLSQSNALSFEWITISKANKRISTNPDFEAVEGEISGVNGKVGVLPTQVVEDLAMPDARVLNRLLTWLVVSPLARVSKNAIEQVREMERKELEENFDLSSCVLVPFQKASASAGLEQVLDQQLPTQSSHRLSDPIVNHVGQSQLEAECSGLAIMSRLLPLEARNTSTLNTSDIFELMDTTQANIDVDLFDLWQPKSEVDGVLSAAHQVTTSSCPPETSLSAAIAAMNESVLLKEPSTTSDDGNESVEVSGSSVSVPSLKTSSKLLKLSPWMGNIKTLAKDIALRNIALQSEELIPNENEDEEEIKQLKTWIVQRKFRHVVCSHLVKCGAPPSDWEFNYASKSKQSEDGIPLDAEVEALMRLSSSGSFKSYEGDYKLSYSWARALESIVACVKQDEIVNMDGGTTTQDLVDSLTSQDLSHYYLNCLLPLCVALIQVPHDHLARKLNVDDGVGVRKKIHLSDIPDPMLPLENHSLIARRIAFAILRRQQILLASREILARRSSELLSLLRTPLGRNVAGCPLWWCPWVHDVALFVAASRSGIPNEQVLRNDQSGFPTSESNVIQHVQRCFFDQGGMNVASNNGVNAASQFNGFGQGSTLIPVASGVFQQASEAEEWAQNVAKQFPSSAAIELRMEQACVALTNELPFGHPLRVRPCAFSYKADEAVFGNVIRRTPLPLSAFLMESKTRRDAYLNRRTSI